MFPHSSGGCQCYAHQDKLSCRGDGSMSKRESVSPAPIQAPPLAVLNTPLGNHKHKHANTRTSGWLLLLLLRSRAGFAMMSANDASQLRPTASSQRLSASSHSAKKSSRSVAASSRSAWVRDRTAWVEDSVRDVEWSLRKVFVVGVGVVVGGQTASTALGQLKSERREHNMLRGAQTQCSTPAPPCHTCMQAFQQRK